MSFVWPSAWLNGVGALKRWISRLNALPARAPVNASPPSSRMSTHDSGSSWFAIPSTLDSFIPFSMPVYPGALSPPRLAPLVKGSPVQVSTREETLLDLLDYTDMAGATRAALALVDPALEQVDRSRRRMGPDSWAEPSAGVRAGHRAKAQDDGFVLAFEGTSLQPARLVGRDDAWPLCPAVRRRARGSRLAGRHLPRSRCSRCP